MPFIDCHCHIDSPAFDVDRAQVLKKAKALGVEQMMIPGLHLSQFSELLSLKNDYSGTAYPRLDIAFGLHPYFLSENNIAGNIEHLLSKFCEYCTQYESSIVAIGEAGLDAKTPIDMQDQIAILVAQIDVAKVLGKPIVLHHRQSHNDLIRVLKQKKFTGGGLIHAFSGSFEIAKTYVDMGFVLGIGGTITYDRSQKTRKTLRRVYEELGDEHLVLETDSPDMPLFGFQGQRNSPERIPLVAKALSRVLAVDIEHIALSTSKNYSRVFSSPTS